MANTNQIAKIGALLGDPSRANILTGLMDGRAMTSGELARIAGVSRPTASEHLARLTEAGMLAVEQQGRHRYYRLASPDIAVVIERVMGLVELCDNPTGKMRTGPADRSMRLARTCYDHLAGSLAVAIADRMIDRRYLHFGEDGGAITESGLAFLRSLGLTDGETPSTRRPFCRACLDWSERRPHIAGRIGSLMLDHFLAQGWLRRRDGTRSLEITRAGETSLIRHFGLDVARL